MLCIDYKRYLDKVFGCWIGKCVAGTIGAPYEGAKELFDFEYDPKIIENMLPNDDLDLQVLWLAVLEEKGIYFTSEDLAEAFATRCPYAPGEYAVFKKNYKRGIHPPMSGRFNNRYYINGMGCPIRSEIWGCVAPGNPKLAAELAQKDGVLDHAGLSVYAEQFLSAMEAAAFFESDLDKLVDTALASIKEIRAIPDFVNNIRAWCKASDDWRYVRSRLIRDYGHPDCTNMFQNVGITLLSLYLGKGDFLKTVMMALNCGFDTDCTCATAGAIMGIIEGADAMMSKYGFTDQGFVLGVDAPRRSDRVLHLAQDTCAMGLHFAEHLNGNVKIENAPAAPVIAEPRKPPVEMSVAYIGFPAIGIGDTSNIQIIFRNTTEAAIAGTASLAVPDGWQLDESSTAIGIDSRDGEECGVVWEVAVSVPEDLPVLEETNFLTARFAIDGGETVQYQFGLIGAAAWQVFGPFWQNRVQMPHLALGESFYKHISGANDNDFADNVRAYHLNTGVDAEREYMTLEELLDAKPSADAAREPRLINTYEDKISVNDLVGYQGPCAVYMVRRLICPEERTLGIHIGHTDAYKLWINGELIAERDDLDWWTAENQHILKFALKQGENTVVVKLVRRSDKADFSLIFAKGGPCTEHYIDMASRNPNVW